MNPVVHYDGCIREKKKKQTQIQHLLIKEGVNEGDTNSVKDLSYRLHYSWFHEAQGEEE